MFILINNIMCKFEKEKEKMIFISTIRNTPLPKKVTRTQYEPTVLTSKRFIYK